VPIGIEGAGPGRKHHLRLFEACLLTQRERDLRTDRGGRVFCDQQAALFEAAATEQEKFLHPLEWQLFQKPRTEDRGDRGIGLRT
jgi:hypothetical protein